MYDCIIVGAGPAGSAAAYHLAKAERSVLILDRDTFPRYKACSGAVSPSIADWFDFDFAPAIDSKITRVRYTWKLGDAVDAELETEPIWSVRRDVFDQFLVEKAQEKGAEFRDGTAVTGIDFRTGDSSSPGGYWQVQTASETFSARYIIAADGAGGPMADWLGFRSHKVREATAFELETFSPVENGAFCFEFGLVKNGCIWCFPKQSGYSIGVSNFIGGSPKDTQTLLNQYVPQFSEDDASVPGVGDRFKSSHLHTHPLKLWDGNHDLHTTNALLVGESAAIVDPLTAEGVRPAMYSGMHAAKAIHAALSGNASALADYTQLIHESWGEDMQWAQRIASVFFRVPKIGYRVGIKRPTATKRLGQILAGEVSYADIANRVIKRISTSFIPGFGK